ncbi:polysaccharide pyruvyl transferase family protein [Microbacterium sp. TS-1]|uniref:polysaccharide pyruvyl transferase family protein n=1 Tax=Microbacterium sp. TS-1 TaxID=1344956 RepID=UPI00130EB134|nr:polysaccharide pyruvyl transferase family protein [Microbacterium sp. TS-1]
MRINLAGSTSDYISGLGLRPGDEVFSSSRAWEASLALNAVTLRRPVFALNAGEARLTATHSYLGRRLRTLARMVRWTGGAFTQMGLGVREAPDIVPPEALVRSLSKASVVTWRDQASATAVGVGEVQPDWAFAIEPLIDPGDRRVLAINMRSDRQLPGEHWLRLVRSVARRDDLKVELIAQVRRDNARLHAIADLLEIEAEVREWSEDEDHAARLQIMADVYSHSRAVVSDRLHSLVLGAIHGAVPIGLSTGSAEKLKRTLAPAGLQSWSFDADELELHQEIELPPNDRIIELSAHARSLARGALQRLERERS